MASLHVPAALRHLTGGDTMIELAGATVGEVLAALDRRHPGTRERILGPDGRPWRHVHVFVGDVDVRERDGLDTALGADDVVTVVPAVAGG